MKKNHFTNLNAEKLFNDVLSHIGNHDHDDEDDERLRELCNMFSIRHTNGKVLKKETAFLNETISIICKTGWITSFSDMYIFIGDGQIHFNITDKIHGVSGYRLNKKQFLILADFFGVNGKEILHAASRMRAKNKLTESIYEMYKNDSYHVDGFDLKYLVSDINDCLDRAVSKAERQGII